MSKTFPNLVTYTEKKYKTDPRVCQLQKRVAFTVVAGCGCRLSHFRSGLLQFQTQRGKVSPICPGTGIWPHHTNRMEFDKLTEFFQQICLMSSRRILVRGGIVWQTKWSPRMILTHGKRARLLQLGLKQETVAECCRNIGNVTWTPSYHPRIVIFMGKTHGLELPPKEIRSVRTDLLDPAQFPASMGSRGSRHLCW